MSKIVTRKTLTGCAEKRISGLVKTLPQTVAASCEDEVSWMISMSWMTCRWGVSLQSRCRPVRRPPYLPHIVSLIDVFYVPADRRDAGLLTNEEVVL